MEHEKIPTLCASCEFCGDAAFPSVQYFVGGELKARLVGFSDRPNGAPVEYPARHCEHEKLKGRVLIYEALTFRSSCPHYKPRSWERPHTCGECQRRLPSGSDGRFRCSGYPFTSPRSMDDEACVNGKVEVGAQLTLF